METRPEYVDLAATVDQVDALESLPQPAHFAAIMNDTDAALAIDVHGDAHLISYGGDITDGTHAHYTYLTQEVKLAAAAHARGVTDYHLGDVCHGVAIERPGFLAIIATDPDRPATGWGYWIGDENGDPFGDEWTPAPATWGSTPAAIGAAFARACRPRK